MRPVDKGTSTKTYSSYQEAAPDLKAVLGGYCSYCERYIETHLAVEHVQPKSLVPALQTQWSNLLLGCINCNSCKGDTPVSLSDYLWPDSDNALKAIEYKPGGLVSVRRTLCSSAIQQKAQNTIILVGLDKDPGNPDINRRPSDSDNRWRRRFEAWQLALKYKLRIRQCTQITTNPVIRNSFRLSAVDVAKSRGEFSIWWTVFEGDSDMRRRLREAFIGTHVSCFDANENLIPHPNGQV